MIEKYLHFLLVLVGCGILENQAYAENNFISSSEDDLQKQWLDTLQKQNNQSTDTLLFDAKINTGNQQQKVWDNTALTAQPELLAQMLLYALNGRDVDLIQSLSEAYQSIEHADKALLKRSQATVLRLQKRLDEAENIYKELLQEYPDDVRNRLDLAAVQFENGHLGDADKLFAEVENEADLPDVVRDNIARFRQAASQQTSWQFDASLQPVRNNNVNNVPLPHCLQGVYCTSERPQSAQGMTYDFSANKRMPISGGHSVMVHGQISGTTYFLDKKSQYDDASVRLSLGWHHQNWRNHIGIDPFYRLSLNGSHEFSNKIERKRRLIPYLNHYATGLRVAFSRQHNNHWQSRFAVEHYHNRYLEKAQARRNNGTHNSIYVSLAHRPSVNTTLFTAYQFDRFSPDRKVLNGHTNNAAFHRHGIQAGWLQNWQGTGGLHTSAILAYGQRQYQGMAAFSTQSQHNREYVFSVSIGHNRIHWKQFSPILHYQYSRINSNQAWAERKSQQLGIGLEKQF